jgi:hypothetical protein
MKEFSSYKPWGRAIDAYQQIELFGKLDYLLHLVSENITPRELNDLLSNESYFVLEAVGLIENFNKEEVITYKDIVDIIVPLEEFLYHATYKSNLKKITKRGYLSSGTKNWGASKSDVVYLATNKDTAKEYMFRATDDNRMDDVVVLKIPLEKLDLDKLYVDTNEDFDEDGDGLLDVYSFEYHGVIPFDIVSVIHED